MLIAVLDADVLFPMILRDTLLRLAAARMFRLHWSERILEEMQRNLVKVYGMPAAKAEALRATMEAAFQDAMVEGWELSEMAMLNDPKDRHVAAAAAAEVKPRAVFLLAPAFYMRGFEAHTPQAVACPTAIVHGWHDDVVPVDNSIRWAREHAAALHLLDSGHRLEDQIPSICVLLRAFLEQLG